MEPGTQLAQVPVIDISALLEDSASLAALDKACRNWGFFQVTGHGLDEGLLSATHEQMRTFFALPVTEKRRVIRTASNDWGFYDKELTKNVLDWKEVFDVGYAETEGPLAGAMPKWPEPLPAFKGTMLALMDACRVVGHRLLSGISINLGMPADYLAAAFLPRDTSFLRLNHYPVCDDAAPADAQTFPKSGHFGVNHHTDAGALTVLLQDAQPGLQVYRDGTWHLIEPRSDALVINIGDIVQVWSNDRYPAPLHRVIASSEVPRNSAPFFLNPAYAVDYAPLSSLCDENDPARYRPINWGDFRARRAAGDYADYGEEIQISQFRSSGPPSRLLV